jgi:hypothetical protein
MGSYGEKSDKCSKSLVVLSPESVIEHYLSWMVHDVLGTPTGCRTPRREELLAMTSSALRAVDHGDHLMLLARDDVEHQRRRLQASGPCCRVAKPRWSLV